MSCFILLRHRLRLLFGVPARVGGLIPEPVDVRDWEYVPVGSVVAEFDARPFLLPVSNQGLSESCTAHAINSLLQYVLSVQEGVMPGDFRLSEAYQWYWHRLMEGRFPRNEGVYLRDGFKVIKNYGFVSQTHMGRFVSWTAVPSESALSAGAVARDLLVPRIKGYYRVSQNTFRDAVLNGNLVVFGLGVDDSFMSLNRSNYFYERLAGPVRFYHAMLVVGLLLIDGREWYVVRNSWGSGWGLNGYVYVSRYFLEKHSFDCWTVASNGSV